MTGYSDEKILREERDEARKEIARLGRVQDQLLTQIQSQKDTIRRLSAGVAAGPQATPDQDERTAAAIGRRVGTLTTDEMAKAIHAAGLSALASDTAASAVMAMLLRTTEVRVVAAPTSQENP